MSSFLLNAPFLLLLVLSIFPATAVAQEEARGISLAPLVFELNANPGDTLSEQIRVTNRSTNTIAITPEVRDFTPVGEAGEVNILEEEQATYSLRAWTIVSPEEISLAPNETKTMTFTIGVPRNAEPGGHYGSILASTAGTTPGGTGVAVAQKVGSLVLLRVTGEAAESLQLREFSAPGFLEKGPVPFVIRFENIGNIHLKPAGYITVTNLWGREVARVELEQKNVIPGSIRRLEPTWDIKGGLGRYTATLTAVYGSKQQNLSGVVTFWIFPWKVGLPVGVAGLVILIYLIRRRRRLFAAIRVLFGRS